jgi:hypothetical protein
VRERRRTLKVRRKAEPRLSEYDMINRDTAALIDLVVDRQTLDRLYALGVIHPDDEPEDQAEALATALSRLSQVAVAHGLQIRI